MLAVAAAQGPPVDAAAGKEEWATEDGVIDEAAGRTATGQPTLLVPPTSTDGTIKFIHSMVATQADMVGEMVNKINPNLHGPLMGLTTMMMAVQEQIPNILSGKPMVEPSSLVHEMFVKYANGTKTDSDLADISKGLDELFTHKFDADDTAKALDLINAKDLFVDKTPKPQLIANKTLNWTAPNVAAWNVKNFSNPLPYLAANTTKFGPAKVTKIDNITAAKYTTTKAAGLSIAAKQNVWDANNANAINPTPPELSQKGGLYQKELAMANAVGNAYKTKDPAVTPYPTDWKPGMVTQGNNFWNAANNQTKLLELDGVLLGANKNITVLPAARIKPVNIYKDSQNRTLQKDANDLQLAKAANPRLAIPEVDAAAPVIAAVQGLDKKFNDYMMLHHKVENFFTVHERSGMVYFPLRCKSWKLSQTVRKDFYILFQFFTDINQFNTPDFPLSVVGQKFRLTHSSWAGALRDAANDLYKKRPQPTPPLPTPPTIVVADESGIAFSS
jgi:hypothetical protein